MLKLSKKVEYGLIAMLYMDSLEPGDLASKKEIAEAFKIPNELLGKVLQSLSKEGLIDSVHGVKGGYRLRQSLEDLDLGRVLAAIEGPVFLAQCQDDPESCNQFCRCNIREPVTRIQTQLNRFINNIKLSALRPREAPESILVDIKPLGSS